MTINRSEAEIIREILTVKPEEITDAYALDLHVRHISAAGHLRNSLDARRGAIRRLADHLDPYAENPRAVIEATSAQLAEWQASKAHLSNKTMSIYVSHLKVYYRWLVRPMRIIRESPAEDLMSPIVRKRKPRPIPEEDLDFALTLARADHELFAWLVLMAYCGCRSHDIADLNTDDVLTDDEVPMLRPRGKGDNEDLIPIGDLVLVALQPFLGRRRKPLFVDVDGHRVNTRDIRGAVNDFFERVGLPYTAHHLRHRYGTQIYKLTRDLLQTQRLMRHSNVSSTVGYVAVPHGEDVDAVKALDAGLAKHLNGRRSRRDLSA